MTELKKRNDGWWITGIPDCEDCGPYDTKAEAEEDRLGLNRFEKYRNRPGYITCEKRTHST